MCPPPPTPLHIPLWNSPCSSFFLTTSAPSSSTPLTLCILSAYNPSQIPYDCKTRPLSPSCSLYGLMTNIVAFNGFCILTCQHCTLSEFHQKTVQTQQPGHYELQKYVHVFSSKDTKLLFCTNKKFQILANKRQRCRFLCLIKKAVNEETYTQRVSIQRQVRLCVTLAVISLLETPISSEQEVPVQLLSQDYNVSFVLRGCRGTHNS